MGADLWTLPLNGDRKRFSVVQTNLDERNGQFSPDGKWIAYESNKSGRSEIYVQPFPGPGGDLQVSSNDAATPPCGDARRGLNASSNLFTSSKPEVTHSPNSFIHVNEKS